MVWNQCVPVFRTGIQDRGAYAVPVSWLKRGEGDLGLAGDTMSRRRFPKPICRMFVCPRLIADMHRLLQAYHLIQYHLVANL